MSQNDIDLALLEAGVSKEVFAYEEQITLDDIRPTIGADGRPNYEIWFSGINIDTKKAWELLQKGDLERLADGVYINSVNPPGMPEMTRARRKNVITIHALRIARSIYKDAPLMGASAYHLSPVEGVLCLASLNNSKYSPRSIGDVLTIYHSHIESGIPVGTPTEQLEHEDTLGTFTLEVIPDEILILQYFTPYRRKPVPQTQISFGDLHSLIDRAVLKRGTKDALLERLNEVAAAMSYHVQLRGATEAINRSFIYTQKRRNQYEYFVYWNKVRTGTLAFDGSGWRFDYDQAFKLRLSLNSKQRIGTVPSFIGSVLPEVTALEELFEEGFTEFRLADRYLSNITIRKTSDSTAHSTVQVDKLSGNLSESSGEFYSFNGTFSSELKHVLDGQSMDPRSMSNAAEDPRSPRMSGVQVKLAGHLSQSGELSLVSEHTNAFKSFTHIIKPPPPGKQSSLGSMEWFGMTLARTCGINTEEFAIADIGGYGPTFIAERFDIAKSDDVDSMYLLEDFWSVFGMRVGKLKYASDVKDVGRLLMACTTDKENDSRNLFKQVLFSWLIVNSDMHLKNLMILKKASPDLSEFESIRLSPAYDILCTNVYPRDPSSAALRMGGVNFYTLAGFRDFGKILKIKRDEVDLIIKEMASKIFRVSNAIVDGNKLPEVILNHEPSMEHIFQARLLLQKRCLKLISEFDLSKEATADSSMDRVFDGGSEDAIDLKDESDNSSGNEMSNTRKPSNI